MEGESTDEMVNDVRLFVKGNEFVLFIEEPFEGEAERGEVPVFSISFIDSIFPRHNQLTTSIILLP
jgi:hypothetical protein